MFTSTPILPQKNGLDNQNQEGEEGGSANQFSENQLSEDQLKRINLTEENTENMG